MDDPKPIQPSRSGGAGREKEGRKKAGRHAPSRRERQERGRLLGTVGGLAEDAFVRDVAAGRITMGQAEYCRAVLGAVLEAVPTSALAKLQRNLAGFFWYAKVGAIDQAYRERTGYDGDSTIAAFYDPSDRTIHLSAENDDEEFAHEVAHGIDGPDFEFTKAPRWVSAYNIEKGRLGHDAYPPSSPQEWWAALASTLLVRPARWVRVKKRLPRTARILEEIIHG